ncbi:hypothetical protein FA09DRAFT_172327 [Tilletiopsis washingtonensis]|uniref:Uncharacterized protein n=1 Tax=Tilletiopsis washingtonensis TaxID=58919 RepID=A0A316Z152_9BASI|nr:hypothetical protein FA09DRAFT_172327 [Tilletiopsis washingtonensis]PWN94668.1 hypothetical protein FA09DRAFT_172327 [Tilletiopsis washingtonensis]
MPSARMLPCCVCRSAVQLVRTTMGLRAGTAGLERIEQTRDPRRSSGLRRASACVWAVSSAERCTVKHAPLTVLLRASFAGSVASSPVPALRPLLVTPPLSALTHRPPPSSIHIHSSSSTPRLLASLTAPVLSARPSARPAAFRHCALRVISLRMAPRPQVQSRLACNEASPRCLAVSSVRPARPILLSTLLSTRPARLSLTHAL